MPIIDPFDNANPKAPRARGAIVDPFDNAPQQQKTNPPAKEYNPADGMSTWEKIRAGIGQGMVSVGDSVDQLVANAPWLTHAVLPAQSLQAMLDPSIAERVNQEVTERQKLDKALLDTGAGTVGSVIGQTALTLPAGGLSTAAIKGAGALPTLGRAVASGLESGAVGGLAQPVAGVRDTTLSDLVTGDEGKDFLSEKLQQVGTGAGVGAAFGGALNRIGAAAERVLPDNIGKTLLNFGNKKANETGFAQEGERLARETGVMLTPAQVSGSKSANMAENAARQSFLSRDIAFEGDRARVQQLSDNLDKVLNNISAIDASPASAGARVQDAVKKIVSGLEDWRRKVAAEDYGKLREMTAKQTLPIEPKTTKDLLTSIVDENSGIGTPAADTLANFARRQLSNVAKTEKLTADDLSVMKQLGVADPKGAISDASMSALEKASPGIGERIAAASVDAAAPAEGNLDKLIALRSYVSKVAGGQAKISGDNQDRRIAAQLLQTIDDDLEAAGNQIGGNVGEQLKLANARFRELSQQIDSVKASPLGKILGEDISGALQSGVFNTVAPETVVERLSALKPSEIGIARRILEKDQPQAWDAFKRSYVETALQKAKQFPASEGANTEVLRPSVLVKNLSDKKKLEAMMGPKELKEINDSLDVARRLADKTGYNFSGTAAQNQLMEMVRAVGNPTIAAGVTIGGQAAGLRSIAKIMSNSQGRADLLQLSRLPPQSERARNLAAKLVAMSQTDEYRNPADNRPR